MLTDIPQNLTATKKLTKEVNEQRISQLVKEE